MKNISLFILLLSAPIVIAQEQLVESGVYKWNDKPTGMHNSYTKNLMVNGKTSDLECFEVYSVSLFDGKNAPQKFSSETNEAILIVKDGTLEVSLENTQKTVTKGSVVYVLPGEIYSVANTGNQPASYFLIQMKEKEPVDLKREKSTEGSFIIDLAEQKYTAHDKGGVQSFFRDRSTAMFGFTEMHLSTLNPQLKSHEPHTHRAAEMVLMLSGQTEMQIGNKFYQATEGDFFFLDSEVLHAIRNTGKAPCKYVAFQWE